VQPQIVARVACLFLSVGTATSAHAQTPDTTRITATRLAEGIYVLMGQGGNIGLSTGPNGAFLIDDEYAPLTDRLRAAVDSLCGCPVRFVLNTHWHRDHTGGNEHLGKAGVLIVAHENTRKRMSVEQFIEAFDAHIPAAPPGALPVVTFTDTITFHLNGDDIRAYHVAPAHTDGDVIIHFTRANVFHMGDTYFNGFYPFIDVGTGGTIEGMIAAADRVLAEADAGTKIIPGHGPVSGRTELAAYREMLAGIRDKVRPMVKAGRSLAQVQAARPTATWDRTWGDAFFTPEQLVTVVFQSLGGK
jgi:glyoxylase-like metal-dependent hydrolase (beta-lactamase superfamily II)